MGNFLEVFCTKIEPSRNKFHSFVSEEPPKLPTKSGLHTPEPEANNDRREKVEDDLEIGNDLLNISQRRDFEELGDIRSRGGQRAIS